MQLSRSHGLALLLGTIGYVAIMAVHPPGPASTLSPQERANALRSLILVHGAGIAFAPVLLYGVLGLIDFLQRSRLSVFAAVLYFFATLALVIAVLLHGIVGPSVELDQGTVDAVLREHMRPISVYVQHLNSTLERGFALGSLLAMLLWSVALYRQNSGWKNVISIAGAIASSGLLMAILFGALSLDHRGMALAIVVPALWFISVSMMMISAFKYSGRVPPMLTNTDA